MPFYHALPEYPGLRHVLVRHEQAAAHAADGYARASGRAGRVRGDLGAGRHQPGDRPRHRAHGQHARGGHHRPGAARHDRPRRLPGDRHHRHHPADHQAQPAGARTSRSWPTRSARRSPWRAKGGPGRCCSTCRRTCRTRSWSARTAAGGRAATGGAGRAAGRAARRRPPSSRPPASSREAQRPLIMAGHGVILADAYDELRHARRADRHPGDHDAARDQRVSRSRIRSTSACRACTARCTSTAPSSRPT